MKTNPAAALIQKQVDAMEARERACDQFGRGSNQHRAAAALVDSIIQERTGKVPTPINFN